MNWKERRLLEMAGILRRGTPDHILFEGEEDAGGDDDPFGSDDSDPFGDDTGDDDAGGDAGGGDDGPERIAPDELETADIEKFGSPRFLDVEQKLKGMFNDAMAAAGAAAQGIEVYPGTAIEDEPTPAKDDEPEEDDEEKNESFYRYGSKRDKWLINEANRLLRESESTADLFDMESFAIEIANYMDAVHKTQDIEAGIFNAARQMLMNNFSKDEFPEMEKKFIDMLSAVSDGKWAFVKDGFEGGEETPVAVGASGDGGA